MTLQQAIHRKEYYFTLQKYRSINEKISKLTVEEETKLIKELEFIVQVVPVLTYWLGVMVERLMRRR
jgi:hypothetical protein